MWDDDGDFDRTLRESSAILASIGRPTSHDPAPASMLHGGTPTDRLNGLIGDDISRYIQEVAHTAVEQSSAGFGGSHTGYGRCNILLNILTLAGFTSGRKDRQVKRQGRSTQCQVLCARVIPRDGSLVPACPLHPA